MAAAGDRQRGDFLTVTGAILLTVDTAVRSRATTTRNEGELIDRGDQNARSRI